MSKSNPDRLTIVKTAGYMFHPDDPERIHAYNSSIKLLMILRDPVERILSWYAHNTHLNKVNKWDNPSFWDIIFQIGTSDINETSLPIMTSRYSD